MQRRAFLPLAAGLAFMPTTVLAQAAMPVVGVLDPGDPTAFLSEFRKTLIGLGYVEGRNIRLEVRSGENNADTLVRRAEELVRLKADVIAVRLTTALRVAMAETRDIPIVMAAAGGPVETGLIGSLARPGGNVTGMSLGGVPLSAKRVQIIREVVPALRTLALLGNSGDAFSSILASTMAEAARGAGVQTVSFATSASELPTALAALERERPDAIHTMANLPPAPIAEMALKTRTVLFATQKSGVEAGALLSYGGRLDEQYRGAAILVDKILRGAKPANLPVQEPSRFELHINMKTARALGIAIPPALLAQAEDLIE